MQVQVQNQHNAWQMIGRMWMEGKHEDASQAQTVKASAFSQTWPLCDTGKQENSMFTAAN